MTYNEMPERQNMRKGYLDICINDRGFTNRPPQISKKIVPTLRAQTHGNPPKVIQIIESEENNAEYSHNKTD
jgi:hypothetical protein